MDDNDDSQMDIDRSSGRNGEKMFTLKKWNAVAMWSWDVECDTCAICRVQVMGAYFIQVPCTTCVRCWGPIFEKSYNEFTIVKSS